MFHKYLKIITSAFVTFLYLAFATVIVIILVYGWNKLNGNTSNTTASTSSQQHILTLV